MTADKTLNDILRLRTGEAKLLLLLFCCDLLRRVASLLLETASSSMFLYEFSGAYLPLVFMVSGLLMSIGAFHFIRIKKQPGMMSGITLIALSIITFMLYLLYFGQYILFSISSLMVWKTVCVILSDITFMLIALRFCNYDWKSWRFIAILLTEAVAMITSGLAVTVLVYFVLPINLIFISTILLFIAGVMLYRIAKHLDKHKPDSSTYTVQGIKNSPRQLSLVCCFFVMISLFIIGGYFIDYAFYQGVYAVYGEWLANMTAFFAMFHVFAGVLTLAIVLLFHYCPWVRSLKATILTLPIFLFIGAAGCFFILLWLLSLSRMGKDIIYKLVLTPTAKAFSVPLLPSLGKRLSAVRRIIVEPLSIIAAGGALMAMEAYQPYWDLPLALLVIAVLVTILSYVTFRLYIHITYDTLTSRYWWGGRLFLEDKKLQDFISGEVLNQDIETTIYFLRVLEVSESPNIYNLLSYSLNNPEERVRLFALSRLEVLRAKSALPLILNLVELDPSPEVRNRALRAYCVIGGEQTYAKVSWYLNNPTMVEGAAIGLLKGGLEGSFIAAQTIAGLLNSDDEEQRKLVAKIIGSAKLKEYYRPLFPLLHDSSLSVRQAAVVAAGKLRTTKLADELIYALTVPELREDAAEGLLKLNEEALPYLQSALYSEETSISLQVRIINTIGRIGGQKAQTILLEALENSSRYLQTVILRILTSKDYRFAECDNSARLNIRLKSEFEHLAWIASAQSDIKRSKHKGLSEPLKTLDAALTTEREQSQERIKSLKELLAYYGDISSSLTLPFTCGRRLQEAEEPFIGTLNLSDRIADLIYYASGNLHSWTAASAIYLAGKSKDKKLKDVLLFATANPDNLIRETAVWALSQVAPKEELQDFATVCFRDNCPEVSRIAHFVFD
ncbi:MAG: HEAT repeat domain-containing protein [Alphaproteobacteria bacterium]|nr:HEAT repeat domain-containing protein [Alphaproteobacteria bacterium]